MGRYNPKLNFFRTFRIQILVKGRIKFDRLKKAIWMSCRCVECIMM